MIVFSVTKTFPGFESPPKTRHVSVKKYTVDMDYSPPPPKLELAEEQPVSDTKENIDPSLQPTTSRYLYAGFNTRFLSPITLSFSNTPSVPAVGSLHAVLSELSGMFSYLTTAFATQLILRRIIESLYAFANGSLP